MAGSLFGTGCSSDYMDTVPTEKVSVSTMTKSLDNLYAALNGIHRKMVSQDLANQGMGAEPGFIIAREAMADDLTWGTINWHKGYLNWSYPTNATTQYNYGIWETYYKFIMNANLIIEMLDEKFAGSEEALAKQIRGECLVIRAWAHFQLVQYYAKPYRNGQETGCDYCGYRNICGFDTRLNGYEYRKIRKMSLEEAIAAMKGVGKTWE